MIDVLLLTLISIQPSPAEPARDRCDCIELNHFYDSDGRPVFDQIIFWQGQHPIAWRLWKTREQTPWRDREQDGYVTAWTDGERLRVVRANSYRESWTQHDPEFVDREWYCKEQRRGLSGDKP